MLPLLIDSFQSKFTYHQKLSIRDTKKILSRIWEINAKDPSYLHLIAKNNQQHVVGILLIRIKNPKQKILNIPFIRLCKKYKTIPILFFFLKLYTLKRIHTKDCYVEHLAVDATMRGHGIGNQLLTYAQKQLTHRGYQNISLMVAKDNKAIHLYTRNGFRPVKHIHSWLSGLSIGISQWIFMQKPLIHHDLRIKEQI